MDPSHLGIPTQFKTERLIISIYEDGDGDAFLQLIQSNYDHLQEEMSEAHTIHSIGDAEAYVGQKKADWISRKRMVPKMVEKSTGKMVGQLWIEPRWERMIFEIGYFIGEESQGLGYITEAVKGMIAFLFLELNANRLEIHTKATNVRSIAVAERCGFIKEAHLRERGRTNEGVFVDMLIYGLLRREYE
jgi:RimJ/RimL family protein N-acetyltransferase